jgi:hypothetical protein
MNIFEFLSLPRLELRAWIIRESILVAALLAVAYVYFVQDFGVVYPQHVRKAEELCANNDGIRMIYNTKRIIRDDNPVYTVRIQCNNDALFLHAEFVDVIDNG